jgi:hypothetical protein
MANQIGSQGVYHLAIALQQNEVVFLHFHSIVYSLFLIDTYISKPQ